MTDLRELVAARRPAWERLEHLLDRARRRLGSLDAAELRELGTLHREVAADLATVRTFHASSQVVGYLNDLALRSHNVVYRAPRRSPLAALRELIGTVPATVRRHPGALAASALLFLTGALLGALGTALDESLADTIAGREFVNRLREGEYWIDDIDTEGSIVSSFLLANNLTVALRVFALGLTGFFPALDLFRNGALLGAVLVLSDQYGVADRFVPFVVGHGVIEISALLLAGAGAFCTFDGWLHPGDRSRGAGLRHGAREGLRIAVAAALALCVAAPVEGTISLSDAVPAWLKIALGSALGLALWGWLLAWRVSPQQASPTS
jgi:uncharacterized membrane protein SpoIIM required for sporulation